MNHWAILTDGLTKEFNGVLAVDNLNLRVRSGELFGIVGPDGAGKTTLMRLLCGVLEPTAGKAEVAGFDILREPEKVKEKIGYMPQGFTLYGDLTVFENLRFFADIYQVPKEERLKKTKQLLEFSRLTPFTNRLAQNLSGGMQKKLALACTLIHTPEILILDEPTTGIDPISRREFWEILGQLLKSGITIFLSTPYMNEAEGCHRLGLMYQGRLLVCDTPENLRSLIKGELIELKCQPQRIARDILTQLSCVQSLEIFGDKLRLVVEEAHRNLPAITAQLAANQIQVSEAKMAEPKLEDIFISLIRRQKLWKPLSFKI